MLGVQRLLDAAHQLAGSGQTAQAQHPAFGQSIGAVLLHGGHTRLTHPLQLDLGARDLLFRLHEIAAVGPDGALVLRNDKVGVLAMEAGEIGQGGVVVGQVLAGMRVAHRNEIKVNAVGVHGGAQGSQTLRNRVHAHNKKPSFLHLPEKRPAAVICRIPARGLQLLRGFSQLLLAAGSSGGVVPSLWGSWPCGICPFEGAPSGGVMPSGLCPPLPPGPPLPPNRGSASPVLAVAVTVGWTL